MWLEGRAANTLEVFLLLCEDLGSLGEGLDLTGIAEWIERRLPGVRVRRERKLCGRIGQALGAIDGAQRLVLGMCSRDLAETELQSSARKAGLDPFGVEVVNLGTFCARAHSRREGTDKAKLLLGAAVAKARAFPGSGPEHAKPLLAWGDTKVSRRALFTLPPVRYEAVPSIRAADCAAGKGCRVCATTCPHQALNPSGEGAMVLDKARCTACGACVTVCPRTAIELPGASPRQFEAHLAVLLDSEVAALGRRGILFLCPKSAQALERLAGNGGSLAPGWLPAEVPCLGMVTSGWLLQCLHLGATAVGLLPCPPDRCRFGRRDTVRGRVDYVREFLLLLGGAADRVKLIDLADESELAHALASVPEQDKEIPPDAPRGALSLTPPQGAANAVLGLAERYGARDRSLEHPDSPLGVVEVEAGCTGCGTCAGVCPSGALVFEQDANEITLAFDPRLCVACRQCVPVCPESVLRVRRVTDLGRLALGKFALHRDSEARCEACGGPVAPRAMLTRISALLGNDQATVSAITRYCVSCRGTLPGGPL